MGPIQEEEAVEGGAEEDARERRAAARIRASSKGAEWALRKKRLRKRGEESSSETEDEKDQMESSRRGAKQGMIGVVRKDDKNLERYGRKSRERALRQQENVFIKNIEVTEKVASKPKRQTNEKAVF